MKLLPYQDEVFSKYRMENAIFVEKVETSIKSNAIINALKQLIQWQGYHL